MAHKYFAIKIDTKIFVNIIGYTEKTKETITFVQSIRQGYHFILKELMIEKKDIYEIYELKKRITVNFQIEDKILKKYIYIPSKEQKQKRKKSKSKKKYNLYNLSIILPLEYQIYDLLKRKGPLNRNEMILEISKARSTIYNSLDRLMLRDIVKKFSQPTMDRGRPVVYFKIKEGKTIG